MTQVLFKLLPLPWDLMQVSSVNEPFKRSLDFPHPFSSPGIKPCWFSKPVYASMWATSWLVIAVWDDFCEIFQFWCPLRFQNSSLILPVRRFPIVWKFLLHDSLPKMSLSPQILCLPFIFIFCPTSFQRDWFAFLGIWGHPPAFRRYSVEVVPHADWSFDVFVGEKVISPSYSSAMLGLPFLFLFCMYLL